MVGLGAHRLQRAQQAVPPAGRGWAGARVETLCRDAEVGGMETARQCHEEDRPFLFLRTGRISSCG